MSRGKGLLALLLVLLLIPLVGLVYLVDYTLHGRNPQYVLERETPPYEEEAKQFFYDNKSNLLKLAQLREQNYDIGSWSYYYLNSNYEYRGNNIPNEMLDILQEIEEATDAQYSVDFLPDMVRIRITSQTDFDVYLCSASYEWGFGEEHSKRIELEDGWVIDTHHVLRG